jgi:hypothetical protein
MTSGIINSPMITTWKKKVHGITMPGLVEDEIRVEYVPGARSGMFRFEFSSDDFSILFKTIQSGNYEVKDGNILEGIEEFRGMKAYIYSVCDQDIRNR